MEFHLDQQFAGESWAREAESIVRKCVHCGFCNATCPTYQLLGDEADGPRGRIYLVMQLLEGQPGGEQSRVHLDRCLLCRSCETTCPSGVRYSRLLETGRELLERQQPRTGIDRLKRKLMTALVPRTRLLTAAARLAGPVRALLPAGIASQLPAAGKNLQRPAEVRARKMLLLEGCAQAALTPETNAAAARVLGRSGITLVPEAKAGCCGALRLHTSERARGLDDIRRRIDTWWPDVQSGVEAIVSTASGCGVTVKEYAELLKDDPIYAEKARKVASLAKDIVEVIGAEFEKSPPGPELAAGLRVAFQSPCSLQHGQKLSGRVEALLGRLGFALVPVADPHLCCGSAGTYSVLQPVLSDRLKTDKLAKLQAHAPDVIATANVGCQLHLRKGSKAPVMHWIELLDTLKG